MSLLFNDYYFEPAQSGTALYRDKGSKFHGFVYPVHTEAEVKAHLEKLRQQYFDASHHCYAFVLNPDGMLYRSNDDGEPAGSAGKPILRAIQSSGLTNILVVVVRYFGGTLLGVPGLIHAYRETARLAVDTCGKKEMLLEEQLSITTDWSQQNELYRVLRMYDARVLMDESGEQLRLQIAVRRNKHQGLLTALKESGKFNV